MALTLREFELLDGLHEGDRAFISAGEYKVAIELCNRGLARTWNIGTGFPAWVITEKGIAEFRAERERLRA